MNRLLRLAVVALMSAVPIFAMAMHHEVGIAEKAGIGHYLTDAKGKTLYWFKKDVPGMSACSGPCLEKWPIFYQQTGMPPAGALSWYGAGSAKAALAPEPLVDGGIMAAVDHR